MDDTTRCVFILIFFSCFVFVLYAFRRFQDKQEEVRTNLRLEKEAQEHLKKQMEHLKKLREQPRDENGRFIKRKATTDGNVEKSNG